jgi:two-component system cell cycle sensor histidine kinase/response regulator CckA
MKKNKILADHLSMLRSKAEERLRERLHKNPHFFTSTEDMQRLIHELSVHQIELEMQQDELIQSREDLEQVLARYSELYNFAPIGYVTLARDSAIIEVNLTAAKMLQVDQFQLKHDRFARFLANDNLPAFNALLESVFIRREQASCEVEILDSEIPRFQNDFSLVQKDSVIIRKTVRIDAVASDDGQECRATLIDLSLQKQFEHENALLQEHLVQAQKMESIGRLAGGVAHDFNNMLQVMLGNLDLLLATEELNDTVRESLSDLRKTVLKSSGLTRQLLAFASKQIIRTKVLDFNAAVTDMLNILKRLIGENIRLIFKPGSDLWSVKMDSSQIGQIMANLAINSKDAIQGVGTITIETSNVVLDEIFRKAHPETAPGQYVLLVVHDDGCGMNSQTLASIFEPFFTTKNRAGNSGLGLATVYGIVRQNHGTITVSSKEAEGTTFKIYLPRSIKHQPEINVVNETDTAHCGKDTILLVEDDRGVMEVVAVFLKSFGYRVLTAESPVEALQLSSTHSGIINLLITDVIMPGMSGVDFALLMKKSRPELKILFISGYSGEAFAKHNKFNPEMPFLSKPFTRTELAAKVHEVLELVIP